ncbi:MAG: hypothetical protein O8C61_10850 [Candidatus Methanoperedens sp.]|nr:hypothetical protein [Candidatus Methanoperedens sp.]
MQDKSEIIEKPQNVDNGTAENIVKNLENSLESISTPIEIFEFDILKAMILYETSQEIGRVWPTILNKIVEYKTRKVAQNSQDFLGSLLKAFSDITQSGIASYYVYTEQALVSAVTASEVYFRNKLLESIQKDKGILKSLSDKYIKIKIGEILETDFNLTNDIGKLAVSGINFQDINVVRKYYNNAFRPKFEFCGETELNELKKIFSIRHVIVHKAGIFDQKFNLDTGLNYEIGKRRTFKRKEIIQMINFLEDIITNLNLKIDNKLKTKIA